MEDEINEFLKKTEVDFNSETKDDNVAAKDGATLKGYLEDGLPLTNGADNHIEKDVNIQIADVDNTLPTVDRVPRHDESYMVLASSTQDL